MMDRNKNEHATAQPTTIPTTIDTNLERIEGDRRTERREWTLYRTRFLVRARQLSEPLSFVDILGREQHGEPGDYLVESSDGFRSIAQRAIFEDIYVPLAPAEPHAPPPHKAAENKPPQRVAAMTCARALTPHIREDRLTGRACSG